MVPNVSQLFALLLVAFTIFVTGVTVGPFLEEDGGTVNSRAC